jgi:hypothetical protein
MRACLALLLISVPALTAQTDSSVIGTGWGLDHVLILLPDPGFVKEVFATKLRFTPLGGTKFPAQGLDQAIIGLPPAYVELLWRYQKPTDENASLAAIARKLEAGGGPVS